MTHKVRLRFVVILFGLGACATPSQVSAPTLPITNSPITSSVEPLKFESVGNGIGVTAFAQNERIEAGKTATIRITFQPLVVRVSRKSDGSIAAVSTTAWANANVTEMQFCAALDAPCELSGKWIPFVRDQELKIETDWIGMREFWIKAQFRDASGAIVPSFNTSTNELLKEMAQYPMRISTTLDERTPFAAMPVKIQTLVATTRAAFPVTGFVRFQNGTCCAGGKAGSTIEVRVEFGASSPFGEVKEMRVRDFRLRKCASETEMNGAAWEPLASEKIFKITGVPINYSSFDVSAQYRDTAGNLSPIYCADLAVEGMP